MTKTLSETPIAGTAELTDDFGTFNRENYISQPIWVWQMWTVIMAFTAMFLAAAILTLV